MSTVIVEVRAEFFFPTDTVVTSEGKVIMSKDFHVNKYMLSHHLPLNEVTQ